MAEGSGRKRARWGEGRVAYAALAPEIVKALEEGLPMSKVHALFEARLGMATASSSATPIKPSSKGERP